MSNRKQTRQRLREAARTMFYQEGFTGASIQRITDLAGYSRGAFYSNYSGKIELLLELLKSDLDSTMQHLNSLARANSQHAEAHVRVLASIPRDRHRTEWSVIWAEATVLAARNRPFRRQFAQIQNDRITVFSAYLHGLYSRSNLECDLLAFSLISLYDGMNLLQAAGIESSVDDTSADTLFTALLYDYDLRSAALPLWKDPR